MSGLTEAAIAAVLAEHQAWNYSAPLREFVCLGCGAGIGPVKGPHPDDLSAAHQASVIWALIEANTTVEEGVHIEDVFYPDGHVSRVRDADALIRLNPDRTIRKFRRHVTGWEEADG